MDNLYLCGKGTRFKDPVPAKYLQELNRASKVLDGALELEMVPASLFVGTIHAAAAEPLPAIAQWVALPPRPEARLCELSASAIDRYKRCPLAFKLSRDWRIPEGPAAPMQYGSAMHTALKAYFDGVRVGRPPDEAAVIACFVDQFEQAKVDDEYQRNLYLAKGHEELRRLLNSELAHPGAEIVETERRFSVQIGDAIVTGRMDRLDRGADGEVTIVDYKTGKAKTQDDADDSLQLSIYALAAEQLHMKPGPVAFVNLENATVVESRRTEDELREARKEVIDVAAKIANGEFEPRKDFLMCRNCSYFSICPRHEVVIYPPIAKPN